MIYLYDIFCSWFSAELGVSAWFAIVSTTWVPGQQLFLNRLSKLTVQLVNRQFSRLPVQVHTHMYTCVAHRSVAISLLNCFGNWVRQSSAVPWWGANFETARGSLFSSVCTSCSVKAGLAQASRTYQDYLTCRTSGLHCTTSVLEGVSS